ncbi:MAG: GH3 auxin-responsive promoter family protein [Cytophagales bacterium]
MPIIGNLLQKGIKLSKSIEQENTPPFELQKSELRKLIKKAEDTQFGRKYKFESLLDNFGIVAKIKKRKERDFYEHWKKTVPLFNYNKIHKEWWHKSLNGEPDITWPGLVRYFALSSGTSESSSKHIPITVDMIKAIKKTSLRQILALKHFNLPPSLFSKGILMLGGSTTLNSRGHYFEGDLSGISASKIPFWFQKFYKPGKAIAKERDWNQKLDEITKRAKDWDIGYIVGVPAWIQLLIERIISYYQVENIHQIWPNLNVFCHGGVSFEPYKEGFQKLLGRPIQYIETYLASEGFIAFQVRPERRSMRIILNGGIFYEFVPFNEQNFDEDGELKPDAETLMIDQIEENKDYAILLSTCAGAWRYLIGDVVKLVDKKNNEIVITGRTKHFLSLCGEHLSVDNMNKAVSELSKIMNISIREFTVAGVPSGTLFGHEWFLGVEGDVKNQDQIVKILDENLKKINDDYATERAHALKNITVNVLPASVFYDWMRKKGKEGGQNKFPRVLRKGQYEEWKEFIKLTLN